MPYMRKGTLSGRRIWAQSCFPVYKDLLGRGSIQACNPASRRAILYAHFKICILNLNIEQFQNILKLPSWDTILIYQHKLDCTGTNARAFTFTSHWRSILSYPEDWNPSAVMNRRLLSCAPPHLQKKRNLLANVMRTKSGGQVNSRKQSMHAVGLKVTYLPSKTKKCKIKAQKGGNNMPYKRTCFAWMKVRSKPNSSKQGKQLAHYKVDL